MSAATVLDQFLDPLSRCLDQESARRVLALGVSAPVQERVDTLAERANEGLLSDDEREEIRKLRRENFELRRANEILKSASVFFAKELDPDRTK